ncbi:MAG: hypothetical protein H0T05_02570 [Acidobacteria bacterium]|nr:hypothetical protein [Acidobacteriota bacterium]MBA3887753.1 hypothetical protein [Acidobacteriota bacterium]
MRTMLFVGALSVVAGLGVGAGERSAQGTPSSPAATLEGTWRVEITVRNCDTGQPVFNTPFPALASFARGGTLTTSDGGMSPAARGAGHGVWWRSQGRTFAALTEAFTFGPTGVRTGTQRLSQEIELDHQGMAFQSRIASVVLDTAGQVTFTGCATSIGRRLD